MPSEPKIFRPRTDGAEYLIVIVFPAMVTVAWAGGLAWAKAEIADAANNKAVVSVGEVRIITSIALAPAVLVRHLKSRMPASFEFLRGVLGIIGLGCAYMAGRAFAMFQKGAVKIGRLYGWII